MSFKFMSLDVFKKVYEVQLGNVKGSVIVRVVICL